jgi:hypothetical protein
MKKVGMLLAAMALAGAAQAGTYSVQHETDCPLISAGELAGALQQAGTTTGLNLPKDMALRTELRCAVDGKSARYVYTIRTTLEKQLADGEQQRWTPVAQLTRYGTTSGSGALLREVRFTARDLIRQEP